MKRYESVLKLTPYAFYLQRRWGLRSARAAGSLRDAFSADYKRKKASIFEILKLHRKGWCVDDWRMRGGLYSPAVDPVRYLNTVEYRRMHPLNGVYSSWIDDKLTLKYLCASADLCDVMPKYYFQILGGHFISLPDCPEDAKPPIENGVLTLLEREKVLAVKQVKGSLGEGFYKLEYLGQGNYLLNKKQYSKDEVIRFLSNLEGYIVTEYLSPHCDMHVFSKATTNTIRYLVGNIEGQPVFLKAFIRFGTKSSGFVENYNSGGVLCYISEGGEFNYGNVMNLSTGENARINFHPDTGARLAGKVPLWSEMTHVAERFCARFPQLQYLGFDFVATDTGAVKMLEINSLTSLDALQLDGSILSTPNGWFFKSRCEKK